MRENAAESPSSCTVPMTGGTACMMAMDSGICPAAAEAGIGASQAISENEPLSTPFGAAEPWDGCMDAGAVVRVKGAPPIGTGEAPGWNGTAAGGGGVRSSINADVHARALAHRSEEHTSALQSLMSISYAV